MKLRLILLVVALVAAPSLVRAQHGKAPEMRRASLLETAAAALTERDGTLSWKALGEVTTVRRENTDGRYGYGIAYFAEPVVAQRVRALAGTKVRVHGYALPRAMTPEGETHFLVSALPAIDEDGCSSGDHSTVVDVRIRGERKLAVDQRVTVEGTLALFDAQRWAGYIYRLTDARILEP